jgi:CHAT domain-containing protein/Tfp pilus assembly protein PilF
VPILLHFIRSFHYARQCVSRLPWVFAVAVSFLTCPAVAQEPPVQDVRSGSTWEGQADGRKTHDYELPLAAGTFLSVEVEKYGVNVSATLFNPGRGRIATSGGPKGPRATEMLALVTSLVGAYQLSMTFQEPKQSAGHYVVRVRESRPAKDGDELRVKAVSALTESQRLRSRKEWDRASAKAQEALTLWGKVADGTGETEALNELGQIATDQEEHQKALTWYDQALRRAQESGYLEGEAWSRSNAGFSYQKLREYDKAIEAYQLAGDLWKRAGRLSEQAFVLRGLGTVRYAKGEYEEALRVFDLALPFTEAAKDFNEQASIQNSIGAAHSRQGKLSDALKAFEKALDLSRQVEGTSDQTIIENNLAALYIYRGQFQKAVEMYESLVVKTKPDEQGILFRNLGVAYQELGDLKEAEECYQRSLAAYQGVRDLAGQIDALTALGTVHLYLQEPQKALAKYEEASKLAAKETWIISYSIGLARLELKEPKLALESLEKALTLEEDKDSDTALTWLAMGTAYCDSGDPQRAAKKFGEAIELGTEIQYPTAVALGLLRRARLWRDEERLLEAREDISRALEVVESTWSGITGDDSRTSFMASKRAYYEVYISILMRLEKASPGSGYVKQALEISERARARGLLNLLAEGRVDVSQGLSADLRKKEDDLLDEISLVQIALRATKSPADLKRWGGKLDELDKRRKSLDLEIRLKHPRYAEVRYPVPRSLPDIQKDLDDRTAILEYALGEEDSTLFVVTRNSVTAYEVPPASQVAKQVRRLRTTLERENKLARREYLDAAFQLYQELIAPARDVLAGKSSLLIAPDGALYYVPFEAFLTEAPGDKEFRDLPYLVKQYSMAYIPSASVLAGLREPRGETVSGSHKQFVALAPFVEPERAPDVSHQSSTRNMSGHVRVNLPSLPASRREVSGIADLYSDSSLQFFGQNAREDIVKNNPDIASAERLHFATHAELDETYPELSALVLASGGEKGEAGEDGFLSVKEIFNLKLAADFVVLSACKTGLGKEVTGEGLIGLTRAFFYAGVPSLVVSLWNVTDGATPGLMLDFYRNLGHRQSKSEALRKAKLETIQKGTYDHPSYWAAFILIGEPGVSGPGDVTANKVATPF